MAITIEKNVAIPPRAGRGARYPFAKMRERGDSFFVEAKTDPKEDEHEKEMKNLRASIMGAARRFVSHYKSGEGPRFYTAVVSEEYPEEDENYGLQKVGVRCWLVEVATGEPVE